MNAPNGIVPPYKSTDFGTLEWKRQHRLVDPLNVSNLRSTNTTPTTTFPPDYESKTYAGVLGKIIGVYLGRPFEGWPNERIEQHLGDIDYYVHEKLGVRLVVTDDDISGTFTFIRALEDYGFSPDLTPKQIGQTWLNYLIERRSVLWWGGLGNSTEHTAYIRLNSGINAPESGSISRNGKVVAEQIGAQIFIDGWAMVNPGDPERAADFAKRAASVSHDGEAVIGAQILAAMEAYAYVEQDIDKLLDTAIDCVPKESIVVKMIGDIRNWHGESQGDWRDSFAHLKREYGYDKYGGNCHIVPNHGLIVLALVHGNGDFSESLKIVNTAGWDTDCNSGNLGCLLGIRNGLKGIDSGPDWRGPFADVCYIPTADSGGGITDAATVARSIIRSGRKLHKKADKPPKNGSRFHFSYPGSLQGFQGTNCTIDSVLSSVTSERVLEIQYAADSDSPVRVTSATFLDSLETAEYFGRRGYGLMTSPMLNPGQSITCSVSSHANSPASVSVAICIGVFDSDDKIQFMDGPKSEISTTGTVDLVWTVPDLGGYPISCVGLQVFPDQSEGSVYLDRLSWHGSPKVQLERCKGQMWNRAWVNGVDSYIPFWGESFRLIQNSGTGLLLYGVREWSDYRVTADITPHLAKRVGIACRVQGMRRYYALVLTSEGQLQLVRELDGSEVLAECSFQMEFGKTYEFTIAVLGNTIGGEIDREKLLEAKDNSLQNGGVALLIDEGRTATQRVTIGSA